MLALSAAASLLLSAAAAAVLSSIASSPVAPVKCSFSSFVLLSTSGVFLSCLSLSSPHLLLLLFFMIILLFFWCSFLFIFVYSCKGNGGVARLEYHGGGRLLSPSRFTWTCASWSPRCCSCCCCDWCCCYHRRTPKRHVAAHDAASGAACLQ